MMMMMMMMMMMVMGYHPAIGGCPVVSGVRAIKHWEPVSKDGTRLVMYSYFGDSSSISIVNHYFSNL